MTFHFLPPPNLRHDLFAPPLSSLLRIILSLVLPAPSSYCVKDPIVLPWLLPVTAEDNSTEAPYPQIRKYLFKYSEAKRKQKSQFLKNAVVLSSSPKDEAHSFIGSRK